MPQPAQRLIIWSIEPRLQVRIYSAQFFNLTAPIRPEIPPYFFRCQGGYGNIRPGQPFLTCGAPVKVIIAFHPAEFLNRGAAIDNILRRNIPTVTRESPPLLFDPFATRLFAARLLAACLSRVVHSGRLPDCHGVQPHTPQREVYGLTFGGKAVSPHHRRAGIVVYINVCAWHTPIIHISPSASTPVPASPVLINLRTPQSSHCVSTCAVHHAPPVDSRPCRSVSGIYAVPAGRW